MSPTPNTIQTKISDDERLKRQRHYEIAKEDSLKRGIELTPETEALMKLYINGEISDEVFCRARQCRGLGILCIGGVYRDALNFFSFIMPRQWVGNLAGLFSAGHVCSARASIMLYVD